ncbi:MAG: hypothetical protein ACYC97_02050 [Metallibacterium sp.]
MQKIDWGKILIYGGGALALGGLFYYFVYNKANQPAISNSGGTNG